MSETGYGRGWQEPKADKPLARLAQIAREPATTWTYIILGVFTVIVVLMANAILSP